MPQTQTFNIRWIDRPRGDAQHSAEPVYDAPANPGWHLRPDIEATGEQDPVDLAQRFFRDSQSVR